MLYTIVPYRDSTEEKRMETQREAYERMYDEAASEYRSLIEIIQETAEKRSKNLYRYNAKTWKSRMLWVDEKLAELGEN